MKKEKLQAIRKQKGHIQQQLSDIIATDVSNYSRKESGKVKIFAEEWEKIARFLEVFLEEIFEDDESKKPYMKPKEQFLEFDRDKFYISIINNLQII